MGKFKDALKMNGILFGIIFVGALFLIIYLIIAGLFTFSQIPAVIATIVNIFGLTLVSIMLGFGLVSFPK